MEMRRRRQLTILLILSGLLASGGCASQAQPKAGEPGACAQARGELDDFGPGVEACRKQHAGALDDLEPAEP